MKENIQTALLAVLTLTMVYGVFIKEDSPAPTMVNNQRNTAAPSSNAFAANNKTMQNNTPLQMQQQNESQQPATPPKPATTVDFTEMDHDFGNINQDTENKHVFSFTNTGSNPLIIESATGSCGCTVPEYPKEPIMPGEKGEIKVVYKPGKQQGNQHKTVKVVANTTPKETVLNITAQVEKM
ncbi:MAG: hypothetical protein CL843_12800 [Crocinitomicaceae bacterium]|nr:hypothetical protein [Crocinitomicaceae bacterium]|tara:strand:- start:2180 stop:2725 length:546 start_codon:yes stop_codon:yes gene_type:complete